MCIYFFALQSSESSSEVQLVIMSTISLDSLKNIELREDKSKFNLKERPSEALRLDTFAALQESLSHTNDLMM